MDIKLVTQIACIAVGAFLVASNFIKLNTVTTWVKNIFKSKSSGTPLAKAGEVSAFIDVISNWYELKEACKTLGLSEACDVLDQVFPLLNKEINKEDPEETT